MDMHAPITISTRVELFKKKNSRFLNRSFKGIVSPVRDSSIFDETLASNVRLMDFKTGNGYYSESEEAAFLRNNRVDSNRKYCALHIEDDEEIRYLVKAYLKNVMEVDSAVDGYEALHYTSEKKYDLIITDINLGCGIDGFEATKEIRNMANYHNIPIIAATANSGSDIRNQCIEVGMNALLLKPFMKNDLISTIEQVMSKLQ